jgi:hypothetical protein
MTGQRQQGGDASTNIQAAGNVIIQHGLTLEEALALFEKNFLDMQGQAMEVARRRAEELTSDFLTEFQARHQDNIGIAADPDVQMALYNAQRGYACSGDDDLRRTLLDLLVDRTGATTGQFEAIVLNEAIVAAPKLTNDQRRAIAANFIIRHVGLRGTLDLDAFYEARVEKQILPLAKNLPSGRSAYQHIEYVGAGTVGVSSVDFFKGIFGEGAWASRGFTSGEVPESCLSLIGDNDVFRASIRDPARLQIAAIDKDDLDALSGPLGEIELNDLHKLFTLCKMSAGELRAEALSRVPELREMSEVWEISPLGNLSLTSIGVAIGHGYWTRLTNTTNAPLTCWL